MHSRCTDTDLLAFLDGELPLHLRWRVQLHLFGCWDCRSRRAELEQQAHRLAQALRQDSFPGPGRVAAARERFEAWVSVAAEEAPVRNSATSARMRFVYAGIACALLGGALSVFLLRPSQQPLPTATLQPPLHAPAAAQITSPNLPTRQRMNVEPPPQAAPPRSPNREATPPADLDVVEADVHYRLHRIGACAGEPILITRQRGATLLVTAVAPPASRRRDIEQAISDLRDGRLVTFEASGEAPPPIPLEAVGDASSTTATNRLSESPVAAVFGSARDFPDRAATVTRLTEHLYTQALGLVRHKAIPASVRSQKSAARWLVESMEREHVSSMRNDLAGIERTLSPVIQADSATCPTSQEEPLAAAENLAAIIHRLFAPATAEDLARAEQTLTTVPAALHRVRCALR